MTSRLPLFCAFLEAFSRPFWVSFSSFYLRFLSVVYLSYILYFIYIFGVCLHYRPFCSPGIYFFATFGHIWMILPRFMFVKEFPVDGVEARARATCHEDVEIDSID